jgi:hypothetical protein
MAKAFHVGRCSTCGKLRFTSRKTAKKFMYSHFGKDRMTIYRCGGYYHFGHTPYRIRRGFSERRTA